KKPGRNGIQNSQRMEGNETTKRELHTHTHTHTHNVCVPCQRHHHNRGATTQACVREHTHTHARAHTHTHTSPLLQNPRRNPMSASMPSFLQYYASLFGV